MSDDTDAKRFKDIQSYAKQMTALQGALQPFLGPEGSKHMGELLSKNQSWDRRVIIDQATRGLNIPTEGLQEMADAIGTIRNRISNSRYTLRNKANNTDMLSKYRTETSEFFKHTLNAWRDRHDVNFSIDRTNQSRDITSKASSPIPLPVYQYQRLEKVLPKIIYRWRPLAEVSHVIYRPEHLWRSLPVLHNPFSGKDLDKGAYFYDAKFWKQEGGYNLFRAKAIYPKSAAYYSSHEVRTGIIASTADTEFVVSAFKPQEAEDDYDHIVADQAIKLVRRRTSDFINRRLLDEPLDERHTTEVPAP